MELPELALRLGFPASTGDRWLTEVARSAGAGLLDAGRCG